MNDKRVIEAVKIIRDYCKQHESCESCSLFDSQTRCVLRRGDSFIPEDWDIPDRRPWTIAEQAFARYTLEQGCEFIQKNTCGVVTRDKNGKLMGYNYTRPGFFDDLRDGDKVSPEEIVIVCEGGPF